MTLPIEVGDIFFRVIIVVTYYITSILKGQQNQGDERMSATIQKLKTAIENAGAILVGAGSGFSTAGSPHEIKGQSILIDDDIASVLQELIH